MKAALNGCASPHKHNGLAGDDCFCPLCERPGLTHDRLIELQVIQQEHFAAIEGEVRAQIGHERDAEIERVRQEAAAAVEAAEQAIAKREAAIRKEAATAANAAVAPKLAEAVAAKKLAEQTVKTAKAGFEATLRQRLEVQVEKAAKERDLAVNAATEKHVRENLTLHAMVQELTRRLEKKTANELGDEGEIDLWEALVAEFPADQIARVPKGVPGADVVQRVFSNGTVVGSIIYDCKNHKAWQNKWTTKLRADQIAFEDNRGADHAVLVATVFPGDTRQLIVRDNVIVASPARAIAVAHMLRRQVLQTHALKLTNRERDEKTARLYAFMTSDRAADGWNRMTHAVTELLDIERSDQAWQEKARTKRTGLIHAVQVIHDEFTGEIDRILNANDQGNLL